MIAREGARVADVDTFVGVTSHEELEGGEAVEYRATLLHLLHHTVTRVVGLCFGAHQPLREHQLFEALALVILHQLFQKPSLRI